MLGLVGLSSKRPTYTNGFDEALTSNVIEHQDALALAAGRGPAIPRHPPPTRPLPPRAFWAPTSDSADFPTTTAVVVVVVAGVALNTLLCPINRRQKRLNRPTMAT